MKKSLFLYTCVAFIALGIVYLTMSLVLQHQEDRTDQNEILLNEQHLAQIEKIMVGEKADDIILDVSYLADSLRLSRQAGSDDTGLAQQWIAFSNRKKVYDQIRFIARDGQEIVRVNYSPNGAYLVPPEQLQNQAHRYYFTDTLHLKPDTVYISKLDLNIENNAIELPIKPMIRFATPYYGPGGTLEGIIIINYSANDLLDPLRQTTAASAGAFYLLNNDGYWLFNSENQESEWGFMYPDRQTDNIQSQFPEEWEKIKAEGSGSFVTKNGLFCFTRVFANNDSLATGTDYSIRLGAGEQYLVSHLSPDTASGAVFTKNLLHSITDLLQKDALIYGLLFLISLLFAFYQTTKRAEEAQIRYFSEYDTMTGAYNRRAGFARLERMYESLQGTKQPLSLCFIDINGLKVVNDTLGHEAGDELIKTVAECLRQELRSDDLIARLGGDEFILVFRNIDTAEAESIWTRIRTVFDKINATENRRYIISVSHGIETIRHDTQNYIDTLIHNADEKMYAEKRQIKLNLQIIRPERNS